MSERREIFERDGFIKIPSLFSPEEVESIKGDIDNYLGENLAKVPTECLSFFENDPAKATWLGSMHCFSDEFKRLGEHERLQKLAEELLDCPVRPFNVNFRNSPPGSPYETPAHQDAQGPNLHPCRGVTFWISLGKYDVVDGCLRYLKGSQTAKYQPALFGPQPNPHYRHDLEVTVPTLCGDVIAHTWFTVHRSESNRGTKDRWALMICFVATESARLEPEAWSKIYDPTYSARL